MLGVQGVLLRELRAAGRAADALVRVVEVDVDPSVRSQVIAMLGCLEGPRRPGLYGHVDHRRAEDREPTVAGDVGDAGPAHVVPVAVLLRAYVWGLHLDNRRAITADAHGVGRVSVRLAGADRTSRRDRIRPAASVRRRGAAAGRSTCRTGQRRRRARARRPRPRSTGRHRPAQSQRPPRRAGTYLEAVVGRRNAERLVMHPVQAGLVTRARLQGLVPRTVLTPDLVVDRRTPDVEARSVDVDSPRLRSTPVRASNTPAPSWMVLSRETGAPATTGAATASRSPDQDPDPT